MKGLKYIANIHRLVLFLAISLMLNSMSMAQTVPPELVKALGEGDARAMSEFFHQSLEMTILDKDHVASKNQATRILENFFREYPPKSFKVSFEGAKKDSKYAIGELSTEEAKFRVNIFFMKREEERLVYYISIEKASDYEL